MDAWANAMITEFVGETGRSPHYWRVGWEPSFDIRPTDRVPILIETLIDRDDPTGAVVRRAELAQWWLTPTFSKELRGRKLTFNARSETVTERATFRGPVKRQRAILLAIGYYETGTDGSAKVPYFIHPSHGLLFFAGLYSWWPDPSKARTIPHVGS